MNKKRFLTAAMLFLSFISFGQNYNDAIKEYLSNNLEKLDLLEDDIKEWKMTNEVFSKQTKVRHVYIQQLHKGIPVFNAVSNLTLKDNKVIFVGNSFVKDLSSKIKSTTPTLKAENAIVQVAEQLKLGRVNGVELMEELGNNNFVFSKSGISQEKISVELVYQPLKDGSVKLSWLLNVYQLDGIHWWNIRVDAKTGVILQKNDWGVNCNYDMDTDTHSHAPTIKKEEVKSPVILIKKKENLFELDQYNVFRLPVESPNHGSRSIVSSPHNIIASPFGWHDTDGAAGAEYTITRGNNVHAQLDDDGENETIGYSPDGGSALNFNFPLDRDGKAAETYKDASLTNLFYVSNIMHDIWYQYGFDEVSGNFQANNYGREAALTFPPTDGDEVIADGQDASGRNNANFATPRDGRNPRMQMFLWDDAVVKINTGSLSGKYTGDAYEASFGASLEENPITANLALMQDSGDDPLQGCSESGLDVAGLAGNIAVIRSSGCLFVNKVQLAQDNNAVAVIVVNSNPGRFRMGGESTTITIPAISVSQELGEAMITALQNGESLNVALTGTPLDGSFDNGIVAHEYGHGISNRLVGGGGNVNCLSNQEQLGEGWSDYFGLAITMKPGDTDTTLRGIGTFTRSEAITGRGIRRYPYTTNMSVNPFIFSDVKDQGLGDGSVSVHGVGSIWAAMLWDLQWKMIGIYGFDSNMYTGNGGNNKTMQLVISGLKLTPCNSGFVGARDAILAADELLNDGVNQCAIWEVFARRGLGYSADSGDADSFTDQTIAFDMPPESVLPASKCAALNLNTETLKMFTVYPNPATTLIRISLVSEVKNATTAIYDMNGREVYSKKSDLKGTVTINTENLSAGIYILKINNEVISYSQKIIIN
ncbi:T9SS-dependent M36 family metallopeptidase [Polaribacter sp. IC066]|uniref:T9SS-dependent M36 family metallopeptidase n=2 Tax=unclassified Polaribacter TaxID=196858 RepID=UPI001CC1CD34|nr:T9SS-dependent M36 family metallopeptidase [Polaribacter sp. IC066]